MSLNSFGHLFRVTTWGESHGPALGAVVDGCPPGIVLSEADLQPFLDARRPGATINGQPAVDCDPELRSPTRRQDRLAPTECITRRQTASRDGDPCRLLRLPGELQGPGREQSRLPVTPPEKGLRPRFRQLAAGDQLGPSFIGLAPQELPGLGQVARFIEDQEGISVDVVQRRMGSQDRGPDFGGIADVGRSPGPRKGLVPFA